MTIYFYDGSHMECASIEIGMGNALIVDGCRVVPLYEVLRIVEG